jgi:hypothetical protein
VNAADPEHVHHDLFRAVIGVVFLGTPFKGTQAQDIAKMRALFYKLVGNESASDSLFEGLDQRSEYFESLRRKFVNLTNRGRWAIPIVCFYETEKTTLSRWLNSYTVSTQVTDHASDGAECQACG